MKQYAGFIALSALILAAAVWMMISEPQAGNTFEDSNVLQQGSVSAGQTMQLSQASGFDFYVLSLSWSPAFCASDQGRNSRQQCAGNQKHGFVVHGLWPQNEQGYPEFCGKDGNERVPGSLGRAMLDIMPSMALIGHQWRKHGTCSGLSQQAYFETTRAAFARIALPAVFSSANGNTRLSANAIENSFTAANRGMTPQGIAISCDGPRLEEVRICLNRDLSFRSCPQVDRKGCQSNATEIIPIQ